MSDKAEFIIRELTGFINLNIRKKPIMTPEQHRKEVQRLKDGVLATALARVFNCGERLDGLIDQAFSRATRSQKSHIQGRLSEASIKLKEFMEIMNDPEIRAFVDPENELPEAMKDALKRSQSNDESNQS